MSAISRNGTTAYIGLPEREATKLQDLWSREEIGVELSVEVRAPVVVGVYPMRIARFVLDQANGHAANGHGANGHGPPLHGGNGVSPTLSSTATPAADPMRHPPSPAIGDAAAE